MTRPSEAEVTRAAKDVLLTFHDWPAYNSSFADGERKRALENLAAALSTPPLPSAEPRDLSGFCVGCGQEAEVDRG